MKKEEKSKKKYFDLNTIYWISFFAGLVFTFTGIVFWFILVFVLKQGYFNIDSKAYSIYYYLSIVAVTIGFGFVTIGFSIRGVQNYKTDVSDQLKKNTVMVLDKFNKITGQAENLFVKEVLRDFAKEWSIDSIASTFVDDQNDYYNKYYDLITSPNATAIGSDYDFEKSLTTICDSYNYYFTKEHKENDDVDYLFIFLQQCASLLKSFESICYDYCNDRVTKRVFENDALQEIKTILLRGYIVVRYYDMKSQLTYLHMSLLKEQNKANILLEEVQ